MPSELQGTYKAIVAYLIPALLSAAIFVLWNIHQELRYISTTVAVAVSRVEDHERRLQKIEERFTHYGP